jgi:hypothetical protein
MVCEGVEDCLWTYFAHLLPASSGGGRVRAARLDHKNDWEKSKKSEGRVTEARNISRTWMIWLCGQPFFSKVTVHFIIISP